MNEIFSSPMFSVVYLAFADEKWDDYSKHDCYFKSIFG